MATLGAIILGVLTVIPIILKYFPVKTEEEKNENDEDAIKKEINHEETTGRLS